MKIQSESEMIKVAANLGNVMLNEITENYVIYLEGDLGAGKTTFVKGFMRGMSFDEVVNSPTFSLIERIELLNHYVFHVDLYRINNQAELFELDLHEESYLDKPAIHLIEWPQKGRCNSVARFKNYIQDTRGSKPERDLFEDFSSKLGNNQFTV